MSLIAIKNCQLVLENGILWNGVVLLENDLIKSFGKEGEVEIPKEAKIIDANGNYVGPGFVDLHVHGGNGFDSCLQAIESAEYFLRHGATTVLATTIYTKRLDGFLEQIDLAKKGMKTAKNIKGIYCEGPYINVNYGADASKNPWGGPILESDYKEFVDLGGKDIKVFTIAPERPDLLPFLEYAKKVNPNVVFSVGHSEATPSQIKALGKYKPTLITHIFDATGRLPVEDGTRGYGPDEYALRTPDMYCELICDSCGIHVSKDLQQMLIQNKGIDKVVLITDCTNFDGETPEHFKHITDLNFDENGGLAGSRLTMDMACRNIMTHTNCGIAQAFVMASLNPAKVIGMDSEIGSIEVGKKADLVIVDDKFNVKQVILNGDVVKL